jgi:SagB-type dehydrogenase family enzyme
MKITMVLILAAGMALTVPDAARIREAPKEKMLSKPDTASGAPLMTALSKRASSRSYSRQPVDEKTLSALLWAACGVNRSGGNKRTAPTAMNRQEIDVYAVMAHGAYRYNAARHSLIPVTDKDIRALTGKQAFVAQAPLNLVYVADMSRVAGSDSDEKLLYAAADTGFIGQNVYLYCASEGLATVIRGHVDRKALARALELGSQQRIILAQTVGHGGT